MMVTITEVLLILILIFIIGNLIITFLLRRKERRLPFNSDEGRLNAIESKIDLLNKRVSFLEEDRKKKVVVVKKKK